MSDPREPSDAENTENTIPSVAPGSTRAEPAVPSVPSFPAAPPAPSTPSFVPPTAPLPPASASLPPIQTPPAAPSGSSYGAPPVYGTPASTGSSVPTPPYGGHPTPAGAPPSGQPPYTATYAPGQIPPRGTSNWMGITSIVLGGLAFVLCWVPLLDIVTAFGALGGLVLGLIAFFRKLGSRALSLTGTIVSGVAFLLTIAMIVLYAFIFVPFDVRSDPSPTSRPSATFSDEPVLPGEPTPVPGEPSASAGATVCADGTAIALGKPGILTSGNSQVAEVTIQDVQLNATDAVMTENAFNTTPPAGYHYAIISLTVKQLGSDSFPAEATIGVFKGVADDIAVKGHYAVLPAPQLLFSPDIESGESVTGNISVFVPDAGAETGSLLVSNYGADTVCEMKVG